MAEVRTVVVTGSASGMGAATKAHLEAAGQRVIGVDQRDADVVADLSTPEGRRAAIAGVEAAASGAIDGLVTWAGVAGLSDLPGSLLVSVNHFGTVALLEGLRPLLAAGDAPAAVAISSNSTTCQPGVPLELVDLCLSGDEPAARAAGDAAGALAVYPATKMAVARWVRRHAPGPAWAGAGITLNVVAPGAVETPMLQATRDDAVIGQFVDAFPVPIGRRGTAAELAAVVAFLLGPDARWFCGSLLFVDGGTDALLRADAVPVPMA
jgi:NAD(P)-dependent dehydrogenase (short-subunit alcohol dehydrogenase family)